MRFLAYKKKSCNSNRPRIIVVSKNDVRFWVGLLKNHEAPDIYQFKCFRDYLSTYYSQAKSQTLGCFTLNSWSKSIGYHSPRVIAMAIKGQRAPSEELQEKLADSIGLKGNKKKYFELLRKKAVLQYKGKDLQEIDYAISRLNPRNLKLAKVDLDEFSYISDWYHVVIKQLTKLRSFRKDFKFISTQLKNKISPLMAEKSVDLLLHLGHLKEVNNNMLAHQSPIQTGNTIPSLAIKKHHEGMLDRAKESLYEDDIAHRHFSSVTMSFNKTEMGEARKMIEEFLHEFDARFLPGKEKAEDIYQINIQFFPHTMQEKQGENV